jgi:PhoPQ-activated pathogenicity-related protein
MRLALLALSMGLCAGAREQTPLDRYVATPDPNYRYELVTTTAGPGFTTYVLDMTSQVWRSSSEVDRPEWRHWVTIVKPDKVSHDTGFLFIGGGANSSKPPAGVDANLRNLAVDTGTVVAELRMVPNQPITFAGESKGRVEDELIAYTWDKYLRGGDDQWPARLPMTKSAVRAMDTVTAFCGGEKGGGVKVTKFVVAGGSKRGWTTWTTAAVDKRVVAIVPMVIDMLNIEPSFMHHWRVYGFWAPAIDDYVAMKIPDWFRHPRYRALMKIEEPYEYRDRFTVPKLLINSTGDQFFLPDSSQFYFANLPAEKHLRYVPNTDHSLRKSDAFETLHAFYDSVLNNRARPKMSWKFGKNGTVRVQAEGNPTVVKLWQASNASARDFRLEKIGAAYTETTLSSKGNGIYEARIEKPAKGFTAYFVEATYPSGGKYPLKFTTDVRVTPDVYPHPPFKPSSPPKITSVSPTREAVR